MGGPAFGYKGPINVGVHYGPIYQMFAFRLFDLPSEDLHDCHQGQRRGTIGRRGNYRHR